MAARPADVQNVAAMMRDEEPDRSEVVLIEVTPRTVAYWGDEDGEIELS